MAGYRKSLDRFLSIAVACLVVLQINCLDDPKLPPGLFYPFGSDVGDYELPPFDDAFDGPRLLSSAFPFHNSTYSKIYVSVLTVVFICSKTLVTILFMFFFQTLAYEVRSAYQGAAKLS
jgi:hypothetical protein